MTLVDINFDNVPDEIVPVEAGIYTAVIHEVPEVKPTKDGKGTKIVVQMKITDEDSPFKDRQLFDHISLKFPTRFKRLCKSAGHNPGADGFDTADLLDCTVRVRVKARTYTDEDGNTKETSGVDDYLFDSD